MQVWVPKYSGLAGQVAKWVPKIQASYHPPPKIRNLKDFFFFRKIKEFTWISKKNKGILKEYS